MKKITALFLCLFLMLGLLAGCGSDKDEAYVPTGNALVMEGEDPDSVGLPKEEGPQELTLVYYPDRSMNPLTCGDYTNRVLFSLIYQNLFNVDSNCNVEPILCKSFQISADSRTYTFYIENGVTFSDGSSLTINDVLATLQAAKESSVYKGRFSHVTDISLTDDGGIAIRLDTPYENFTQLLDIPILKSSQLDSEYPLGTGPYALSTSLAGTHLRKVTTWWCTGVDVVATAESISLVEAENPSQIRDQFEFYDVGLVCADPCSDMYADYRCDYELWDIDNGIFLYIGCNVAWVDFLENATLRSMLTYGIDRDTIVAEYYNGYAQAATLAASPSSPYYSKTLAAKYSYDAAKFLEFLTHYTLPDEPIRLLVNSDDSIRVTVGRYIAETFTEFGLPMETLEYSTSAYQSAIVAGNYDLYLGQTRLSSNMDLSPFFAPYGNLSRNGIADPTTYNLCLESLANSGNYYNLHQQVATEGRIIPIAFYRYAVYAIRGLLTDLTPARDNLFYYSLGKTLDGIQIPTDYADE